MWLVPLGSMRCFVFVMLLNEIIYIKGPLALQDIQFTHLHVGVNLKM